MIVKVRLANTKRPARIVLAPSPPRLMELPLALLTNLSCS